MKEINMLRKEVGALALKGLLFIVLFAAAPNQVQSQMHHHAGETLGTVSFPVSCVPSSQPAFNEAMTLFHHMTYPQAREAFQKIADTDTLCAMAYWGVAMTLFQPLWPTRPSPQDLQRGWEAMQKATSLNPQTERERLLVAATASFFDDPNSPDYWKRIQAWFEGMEKAYAAFPKDNEVAALYSLSLLATVRPDQTFSPNNARAAEILLRILRENPAHPGAMHYLIHANDAPGRERESLEILREYEAIAPDNPHALHMPTHIYTRLGNWGEVIRNNIRAAEAALKFPAGNHGQFVWDEFPHAIEYMVYAYLQTGADDEAANQLNRLRGTAGLEPSFKTAFHLASTKARYALERKAWTEATSIVPREQSAISWDRFPWAEAISWFGRGLGFVHEGNLPEAKKSLEHLLELEHVAEKTKEVLFTRHTRVLRLDLEAWITDKEGKPEASVPIMTQAAELEAATPKHAVTPGPTLPAYELLGDLQLAHGKSQEALNAYRSSLEMNPLRFNSLLGAARAARAMDSTKTAASFYQQLIDIASKQSKRDGLEEARRFLQK